MKRDPDLIRHILIAVENADAGEHVQSVPPLEGRTEQQIQQHVKLLIDARYLVGGISEFSGCSEYWITGLTWQGHDFIDAARDETLWAQAKEKVRTTTGTVSVDVFKELLVTMAKAAIGM